MVGENLVCVQTYSNALTYSYIKSIKPVISFCLIKPVRYVAQRFTFFSTFISRRLLFLSSRFKLQFQSLNNTDRRQGRMSLKSLENFLRQEQNELNDEYVEVVMDATTSFITRSNIMQSIKLYRVEGRNGLETIQAN